MQRHLNLCDEGRYFDLREIFDRVNARHFRGRLRGYKVVWGQRRKERPREYFIFGSIQEEDRVIRIHPLLDQPFVPRWFLEYVLYHEMLHVKNPPRRQQGRTLYHRRQFRDDEQHFERFDEALKWLEKLALPARRKARRRRT